MKMIDGVRNFYTQGEIFIRNCFCIYSIFTVFIIFFVSMILSLEMDTSKLDPRLQILTYLYFISCCKYIYAAISYILKSDEVIVDHSFEIKDQQTRAINKTAISSIYRSSLKPLHHRPSFGIAIFIRKSPPLALVKRARGTILLIEKWSILFSFLPTFLFPSSAGNYIKIYTAFARNARYQRYRITEPM